MCRRSGSSSGSGGGSHYPQTESSLGLSFGNLLRSGEVGMSNLGVFGETVVEELAKGLKTKR